MEKKYVKLTKWLMDRLHRHAKLLNIIGNMVEPIHDVVKILV